MVGAPAGDRFERDVVVIGGCGHVGLPLAIEFAKAGFAVTGIDVQEEKVARLNWGESYVQDVPSAELSPLVQANTFRATTDFSVIADLDTINIAVPTPLRKTKDPDMSYVVAACQEVAKYLSPGKLVILESTTYPGTTNELVLPMLEQTGLKVGEDFFLCFSPERIDPGNPKYSTINIPKVVGGITPACTKLGSLLYSQALEKVVPVSSTSVAEMVKLLENTFRMVNIGFANEVAQICRRLGVDVWEVIDSAATKPYGFMPFYPGPGVGGHCIPVDPSYLEWKMRNLEFRTRFIDLGNDVNQGMPDYVVQRANDVLNDAGRSVRGSRILLIGVAYKPNIGDVRESPAIEVAARLLARGALVRYADPHVPSLILHGGSTLHSVELTAAELEASELVVITTAHDATDWALVREHAPVVLDTRGVRAQGRAAWHTL